MNKLISLSLVFLAIGLTANNPSITTVNCLVKMSDDDIRSELSKKDPLFLACFEGNLPKVTNLIKPDSPQIRTNEGNINTLLEATLTGWSRSIRTGTINKNYPEILRLVN